MRFSSFDSHIHHVNHCVSDKHFGFGHLATWHLVHHQPTNQIIKIIRQNFKIYVRKIRIILLCNRVFLICPENRKRQIKKTNLSFFVQKICPMDKFGCGSFSFFFVFFVFVETHHKQTVIFAEDKSGTRKHFSPENGQIKNRQICPGQIRNTLITRKPFLVRSFTVKNTVISQLNLEHNIRHNDTVTRNL